MSLEAIKLELIEWLTKLENEDTLQYLKVRIDSGTNTDWFTDLSPTQQANIERGLQDVDASRSNPYEEVKKRFGLLTRF